MKLTIEEIKQAIAANIKDDYDKDLIINNVEFDARKITPGSIFIPMKGARDGQEFISQAIDNGACAIVYEDDKYRRNDVISLQVADTLEAFQRLASYFLQKISPKVLAITGSNGKTTTKDMTYAVVKTTYQAYKTKGNYNNNIGLPYTILQMPDITEVLVLEMGMDGFGQIEELSNLARPSLAAITLIGESHIEHLGSRVGIAKAKMEIVTGMPNDGVLIIPANEPLLLDYEIKQKQQTFGLDIKADISAKVVEVAKDKTLFRTNLDDKLWEIPVLGDYNVANALIAISFGRALGIDLDTIREGLAHFSLTKERTEWQLRANKAEILSDVYNANPTAMRKVLDNFAKIQTKKKKIAVLGDMLELGEKAQEMHASVADVFNPKQIDQVYLYGDLILALYEKLSEFYPTEKLFYFATDQRDELIAKLDENLTSETMTLFKASNGMNLAEVVTKLVDSKDLQEENK